MAHHLYLVGYRGTGKTSIGSRLSEVLRLPMVDTDQCVERTAGKSIRVIFSEIGESGFRDLETQAIHRASEREVASVISLGGGAILRESNRAIIQNSGAVVWLRASIDEIAKRIFNDSMTAEQRPALTDLGAREEISRLLEIREPLYREVADYIVPTDDRTIDELALDIADWYSKSKFSETGVLNS